MPNYCENDVRFIGPKADIDAAMEFMGLNRPEPAFDLEVLAPYPEEFKARDKLAEAARNNDPTAIAEYCLRYGTRENKQYKDGFTCGGYEWCIEYWGTKWGAYDVRRADDGRGCSFNSAWSPPAADLFVTLSEKFPRLRIKHDYYERGAGFQGHCQYKAGEQISEVQDEYRGNRGG